MWLDTENEQDPYNRTNAAPQAPNTAVGAGGGTTSPGGTTTAGTAASGTSSNPSTATPAQTIGPTQTFATVQDYLGGNKAQGEQLGQNFSNKLGETATNEKNTIAGAADTTKQDITANTINYDASLVNRAATDPTKVTGDSGQLDSFLKQWNAAYKGPDSFESSANYGTAANAATKANEKAEQLKTAGGQQQLLQDEYGVYGQGNKGLDQALLQTSSYFPKVQDQAKEFGGIQNYLSKNAADVNSLVPGAKNTTAQTKAAIQDKFLNPTTGTLAGFQSNLDRGVTAAQQDAATRAKQANAALTSATPTDISDADLQNLGVTRDEYNKIQYEKNVASQGFVMPDNSANIPGTSVDLTKYLTSNQDKINRGTVITPQDYAKAQAYKTLTENQNVLPSIDAAQVGTPVSPINFDKGNLMTYLQSLYDPIQKAAQDRQTRLQNDPKRPVIPKYQPGDPVFKSQPVLPSQPIPQFNPGISPTVAPTQPSINMPVAPVVVPPVSKPATGVLRAGGGNGNNPGVFHEGGTVPEDNLQNYFKKEKR